MTHTHNAPSTTQVRHLIGGEWKHASDGATFESIDPHDGSLLGVVPKGTAEDGQAAITAARHAFDSGPWPQMSPKERAKILHAVADKVDEHREELAQLETRDGGKGITSPCTPKSRAWRTTCGSSPTTRRWPPTRPTPTGICCPTCSTRLPAWSRRSALERTPDAGHLEDRARPGVR